MSSSSGRALLMAIKDAAGRPGPQLVLKTENNATLRPVATHLHLQSAKDVTLLTEWRNKFRNAFLTDFLATDLQTSEWLSRTVGPADDRILFMIDVQRTTVGYAGLAFIDWDARYAEADAVVRGIREPRIDMRDALNTLLHWAYGQLCIERLGVRVRSDNPALDFYRDCGFVEERRVPLSRIVGDRLTSLSEDPTAISSSISLVYHSHEVANAH